MPPGIYFDTPEFTISVWIYPMNVDYWAKIIDFGNGEYADNIMLSLSLGNTLQPYFKFYSGSNIVFSTISAIKINLNQWQFLTATNNGTIARVYLNGTLVGESNIQSYIQSINLSRSKCYIGKSNSVDGYSSSYVDDLRFYNKSLTQEEILELINYNQNETSMFLNKMSSF